MTTLNGLNGSWSHGIMSQNENTENTSPHHATQLQLSWSAGAGAVAGVGAAGCCVIIHDCCWLQLPRTAVVLLQPRRRSDPRDGMRKTNSEQFYTYTATVSPRYHRSILLGIANNCRPIDAISKCKFSIGFFHWFTALNCIICQRELQLWLMDISTDIWRHIAQLTASAPPVLVWSICMAANQSPSSLKVEIFNNGDKLIIESECETRSDNCLE